MRILARSALSISLSAALLVGCGGSQPTGVPLSPLFHGLPAERAHPDVSGFGTLFAISRSGKETVIHNFGGPPDGANPSADLIDVNGTLYGTTSSGGANNGGTVFAVTASGAETVLHSFGGSNDGRDPVAGLVSVKGTLYGTTLYGGRHDYGTVYSITPSGTEAVLHNFEGDNFKGSADGTSPASMLVDVNGPLYGTTEFGGSGSCGAALTEYDGCGTVFRITTSGKETVLHDFDGFHGWRPYGGLVNVNGTLYGTTVWSPVGFGHGIVFKISTSGTEATIYTFQGKAGDGASPYGGLLNVNGTLYGTTDEGGAKNRGTFYAITTSGAEKMLHSFGAEQDGSHPYSRLVNVSGKLYGTTTMGRRATFGGTVFAVTTSGAEMVVDDFSRPQKGRHPYAGLINIKGTFYGTTEYGGANK
ncbi:MAG: choice-of-anchor tandem repeat GloVer-containing protein [Candidatus Cybelea sp.]